MEYKGGKIEISDGVIREIVFRSAVDYLKPSEKEKKKLRKNINIQRTPEDHLEISIKDIVVPYPTPIKKFIGDFITKIKEDVERLTEMTVDNVYVQVGDIAEEGEEEEESVEEEVEKEEGA